MSFFELLKTRRSIRKYSDQTIEPEKVSSIIEAALMSPASKRRNPWEFIVVRQKDILKQISESRPNGSQLLANSPLGIVVIADTNKSDVWIEDAAIASIIMQLEAHDMGLGSCWIQIRNRNKNEVTSSESFIKELLNIPDHFAVLSVISIGYPFEEKPPHDPNSLEKTKVHFDKF